VVLDALRRVPPHEPAAPRGRWRLDGGWRDGGQRRPSEDRAWALVLLVLAALEHVNYFVRQLMHDTPADVAYWRRYRRLRRPPLRDDLDAAAARRRVGRGPVARRP
jgi:hypothetical protein